MKCYTAKTKMQLKLVLSINGIFTAEDIVVNHFLFVWLILNKYKGACLLTTNAKVITAKHIFFLQVIFVCY